ncbi:AraC family transcriptional regulator [Nitrincola tapanii]|uniref:AraC family transcriptional regulator n=1 Tax=Nitrincola tapanii TaxID=1708751 RepID=A0A5A9VZ54_9GAMM|nr:AraC family transcriptional regulator [Nitrincola tapanii]KAA0873592.1 AraC family transcriptional regulator [Nitrincola tapanii]
MLNEVLAQSVVFHATFPSEVSDYVNRHLGQHRLEMLDKETSRASLHYREFADIGLSKISYGNQARVICPDLVDIYHFQLVTQGQCYWRMRDQELLLKQGQALMLNPQQSQELIYSPDCEKLIVKVPREILNAACLDYAGNLPRSGVQFASRVVDLNQSLAFMRLFEAVLHEADQDEIDLSRIDTSYRNLLLQKMIASFPSNICQDSEESSRDKILSRALSFIREHIKEEIAVDELADLCNVSTRTLYNLFAKHLDSTPKQYIKNARLKDLQNEILHNRKIRNVTEVALDYGFTHLGRFSSDYRRLFGELPSETFRRSRG